MTLRRRVVVRAAMLGAVWWLAAGVASARAEVGLHQPAVSPDGAALAFSCHGDIWRCPTSGGTADRVTAHPAYDGYPAWSPDAQRIAFSSRREGNYDVYVIPAEGGEPVRLTFHPADDIVCDWSPDGSSVLFSSARRGALADLYTVSVTTGRVRRITQDPAGARDGRFARDGLTIYYASGGQRWWETGYRGPAASLIRQVRANGGDPRTLTDAQGFDGHPAVGLTGVYCASVRDGRFSIQRLSDQPTAARSVVALSPEPIAAVGSARDRRLLIVERAGELWALRGEGAASWEPIRVSVVADVRAMDRQTVRQTRGFADLAVSPDGKRVAFIALGDLWTAPLEAGDAVRMTATPGPERQPSWSPDGKQLVYAAVRERRTDLFALSLDDKRETRLTDDEAEERTPRYAPDGSKIAFIQAKGAATSLVVRYLGPAAEDPLGASTTVAAREDIQDLDWSPDGLWLAYTALTERGGRDIYVVPAAGGVSVNVTAGAGDLRSPRWSRDGRFLACVGAVGSIGGPGRAGVFMVTLAPDRPVQMEAGGAPPSGETGSESTDGPVSQRRRPPQTPAGASSGPPAGGSAGPPWPFGPPAQPPRRVTIAFDGIRDRLRLAAPVSDSVEWITIASDGRTLVFIASSPGGAWLAAADTRSPAGVRLGDASGGKGPVAALPDGSALVWLAGDGSVRVLRRGSPAPTSPAIACTAAMSRREASLDAFREAWRAVSAAAPDAWPGQATNDAITASEQRAASAQTPEDFADAMLASFARAGSWTADAYVPPARADDTGYLGLDFDYEYEGPGVRIAAVLRDGPCTGMASAPVSGEYLHSIDGSPCANAERVWELLRGLAGKEVSVVVGVNPPHEGEQAEPGVRSLRVRAISGADALRLRREAETARLADRVAELSSGTVRYIRPSAFDEDGVRQLTRDLWGDAARVRAWLLDLRDLGLSGDSMALLRVIADPGQGASSLRPLPKLPVVVLVNEATRGGAEAVAHALKALGRAEVVGRPTSGLVCETQRVSLPLGIELWTISGRARDVRGESLLGRWLTPDYPAEDRDRQIGLGVERALALAATLP